MFWTTEIYAGDAAFAAHGASQVHAAAAPVFTGLIAGSGVLTGETLMATGLAADLQLRWPDDLSLRGSECTPAVVICVTRGRGRVTVG